uniref:Uncharacterized protein n=1 Tax=Rhizophora mucronata TaxID=61149 RepID=A0A2P2NMJ0_RHIMU
MCLNLRSLLSLSLTHSCKTHSGFGYI